MASLPESVYQLRQFPAVEDLVLLILRAALPDVPVYTLVPEKTDLFPFVLVRADYDPGNWKGDHRFLDRSMIAVHTFTEDPDGDDQGAVLSEAIRVILANFMRNPVKPDGSEAIRKIRMTSRPRRVPDWATSQGPVQYADLPTGAYRYESLYRVTFRRPGT